MDEGKVMGMNKADESKVEEAEYKLEAVQRLMDKIQHKEELKEQLKSSLMGGAIRYDKDPVQGGIASDKLSDIMSEVVDMEKDIAAMISRMQKIRARELKKIDKLPDQNERIVLKRMYLDLEDIWTVKEHLGFHVHSVYRIRKRGLLNYHKMWLDKRQLKS